MSRLSCLKNLECKIFSQASSFVHGQWFISNNLHPQCCLCILLVVFKPSSLWLSLFSLIQQLPDICLLWTPGQYVSAEEQRLGDPPTAAARLKEGTTGCQRRAAPWGKAEGAGIQRKVLGES